jgi:nucleoside-diphosphate-sugar epimerase
VFASSIDIYDVSSNIDLINELHPINPATLYGASKYYGEYLIRAYSKEVGCGYAILRYGHIFGPGEEAFSKLVPITIKNILNSRNLVVFGMGSAERDLLYVDDAVEAAIRAASSSLQEIGPVNIVRGESMTIRQIVELIIRLSGSSQKIHYLSEKADGYSLRFDSRMMGDLLGIWQLVSCEEGLKREIEEFQRNNTKDE